MKETCPEPSTSSSAQIQPEFDSPNYILSTQESNEDLDVKWDWNSPKARSKGKQKRPLPIRSPKMLISRQQTENRTGRNLEKLHEELKALQEELALPDDESCLCVSPQQEQEFKDFGNRSVIVLEKENKLFEEFFNDSVNDDLVFFSQQVENSYNKDRDNSKEVDKDKSSVVMEFEDDNFDMVLSMAAEKELHKFETNFNSFSESIKKTPERTTATFPRTLSNEQKTATNPEKTKFQRTRSFGFRSNQIAETIDEENLSPSVMEEIEQKRLEALARREAKRTQESVISPSKCSAEEIEKKRLEAVAKLEAKKMQDMIEKKRQEALKRLQTKQKRSQQ